MTRRQQRMRHWQVIALLAIAVLLLSACSGGDSSPQSNSSDASGEQTAGDTSPGAITPGGELIWALGGVVTNDNLDAHKAGNAQNGRVMRSLYDSLVVELPDYSIKPWLATSWEVSEDGRSYTFQLREDVVFHDGTPFNAEAVQFNFERIKDPATKAGISLNQIGSYVSSEVVDEFTVRVNFAEPYAPFLSNLAKVDLGMVSPTAAREHGEAYPQNPVGTGPFRLAKLTAGVEVELEKNPDYNWAPESAGHQGPAYLDKLTVKFVPEEATRVSVLQSGQVHAADIIPPQDLVTFQTDDRFHVQEVELLQINHSYYFNLYKEIWQDLTLRKAIRAALNLEAAVNAIYLGTSKQAWSPLSTQHLTYNSELENSWSHDLDYANNTLDQLGWIKGADGIREKDGQRLVLEFIDTQGNREKRLDLHAVMTQQLKQAGIEMKLVTLPSGTYSERRLNRDYDFVAASQFSGDASILRQIFSTLGPTGDRNVSSVHDEQLEAWLEEALVESDAAKRTALYQQAQAYIIEQVYSIPTYVFDYSFATAKSVHGITFDNPAWPVFYDAWIEN